MIAFALIYLLFFTLQCKSAVLTDEDFLSIDETTVGVGEVNTCIIENHNSFSGKIKCFGSDLHKMVGEPPSGSDFVQITCGTSHCCALRLDGTIECFGSCCTHVPKSDTARYIQVTAGGKHACGLLDTGEVHCWGKRYGDRNAVPTADTFVQVSSGKNHACGILKNGTALCWGSDTHNTGTLNAPKDVQFLQLSSGISQHTCGITTDYKLRCWGENGMGQCFVDESGDYLQVSSGQYFTCAIRKDDRTLKCWGALTRFKPMPATTDKFLRVVAGSSHFCTVTDDPSVTAAVISDDRFPDEPRVVCYGINHVGCVDIGDNLSNA